MKNAALVVDLADAWEKLSAAATGRGWKHRGSREQGGLA